MASCDSTKQRTGTIVSFELYIFRHSLDAHVVHIDVDINMYICVCAQLSVSNARLSL